MMYCLIYPLYSLFIGCSRKFLNRHFLALVFTCGFLSFLTGQLVQLPFMLISGKITAIYILMGLKTSLIPVAYTHLTQALCLLKEEQYAAIHKSIDQMQGERTVVAFVETVLSVFGNPLVCCLYMEVAIFGIN